MERAERGEEKGEGHLAMGLGGGGWEEGESE
jgi:hypothetical protein